MLQRLPFIMSVTSATSGALADGEQGDARGGKQNNGHTVRCDGRTGVGGGSSRGTGLVTGFRLPEPEWWRSWYRMQQQP